MPYNIDHQMTALYCFVDEFLQTHPAVAQWRHSPYARPPFSDAEVLTIALLQGVFEVATLKQTYRLVAQNWRAAFPDLPSYKSAPLCAMGACGWCATREPTLGKPAKGGFSASSCICCAILTAVCSTSSTKLPLTALF